jgi:hypothetical protein
MKTKFYVGIALLVFFVFLLVVYSAGFAQEYLLRQEANQQLIINKQDNCTTVNIAVCGTNMVSVSSNQTANPVPVTPVVTKPIRRPITRAS